MLVHGQGWSLGGGICVILTNFYYFFPETLSVLQVNVKEEPWFCSCSNSHKCAFIIFGNNYYREFIYSET